MLDVKEGAAPDRCSSEAGFAYGDGRIPIMLGGIGHRELSNKEQLADIIATQCEKLKKRYPNSPFVLLSPIAEGADRLIASLVIEHLKADLIVVLPMPRDEYEKDFATKESRAEFAALIAKARCVKIAPLPKNDTSWTLPGKARDEQYARAGAIIADHAQILFAIFDPARQGQKGGTADQVAWFDRGFAPANYSLYDNQISPLDPPEPGLRISIDPVSLKTKEIVNPQAPTGARRSNILSILGRTERFNRDVLGHPQVIEGETSPAAGNEDRLADCVFRTADRLSTHFARRARFDDRVIYLLAIVAIISFNFVSTFPKAVIIYLGVTLAMLALYFRSRLRSIDNRFLEYRALAEPLRVFRFWRRVGVSRSMWLSYLSRHEGIVHWLRHAARTVEFCQDCITPPRKASAEGIEAVKRDWVQDQLAWFAKRVAENERHRKRFRWLWGIAIGASFVVSIILFLMTSLSAEPFRGVFGFAPEPGATLWQELVEPPDYGNLWQAALAFLAAGGLAARGYSQRRGDADLAKQYASQRRIFETANDMLIEADAEWTPEQILDRLGEQALQEQAEFVWLRHARPFEVPQ